MSGAEWPPANPVPDVIPLAWELVRREQLRARARYQRLMIVTATLLVLAVALVAVGIASLAVPLASVAFVAAIGMLLALLIE